MCFHIFFLYFFTINCGESSSGKGKRPITSRKNEKIIVSSSNEEEEQTISKNKKKTKLTGSENQQNKNI